MSMCLNDVSTGDVDTAVCAVAAFFVDECTRNGVDVSLPTQCVKCTVAGDHLEGDDVKTIQVNELPQEADVVFVVSEKDCNEEVVARLADIASGHQRVFPGDHPFVHHSPRHT